METNPQKSQRRNKMKKKLVKAVAAATCAAVLVVTVAGGVYWRMNQRIEIEKERFDDFITMADQITAKMKELGFVYITLDAEGFRSGSMDVHIVK